MTKPAGRRRVTSSGRREQFVRQPHDYQFKLKVIGFYAQTDIASTIARFFPGAIDAPNGSKRKLARKWKQQREHIEQLARRGTTANQQRARAHGLATTLSPTAEASIVKWINDFRRDGMPVSATMLKVHALEQTEELEIFSDAFAATWQWQNDFMKQHRFSLRTKTHTGQTVPPDALEQAAAFAKEVSRRAEVEGIKTIYNVDQTAVFFELLPRTTITEKGTKTVWVKCGKKAKERMIAMVLGDSHDNKLPLFLVLKTSPSKAPSIGEENKRVRHDFGRRLWAEIKPLQDEHNVRIYGNQSGWWTGALTVEFLCFHFGHRSVFSDPVILLLITGRVLRYLAYT